MLAKANRIVSAADYKAVVRFGRRRAAGSIVIYVKSNSESSAVRFGFIVAKAVGKSVTRNRVRRRLKSVAYELLPTMHPGTDVVVRALPASSQASWATLRDQLAVALTKGMARA